MGYGARYCKALEAELKATGKTVNWLSKATGIAPMTLYSMLKRGSMPTAENNRRITNALDVPPNYFLQAIANPEEPVQAVAKWEPTTKTMRWYACPVCANIEQKQYNFCPVCGTLLGRCKA